MRDPAEWRRWLSQAEYDLAAARHSALGGYNALACYLAQQETEKALKAFLYHQGARGVFGHAVVELCRRCAKSDAAYAPLVQSASKLDRLYIPTRYPNGLPGGIPAESYDAEDAQLALDLAEKFLSVTKNLLPMGEKNE